MKQYLDFRCRAPAEVIETRGLKKTTELEKHAQELAADGFAVDLMRYIKPETKELSLKCSNPFDNLLGLTRFFKYVPKKVLLVELDFSQTDFNRFSLIIRKLISSIPPSVTSLNLSSCGLGEQDPVRKLSIICEWMPLTIKTINLSGNQLNSLTVEQISSFDRYETLRDMNVILSDDEVCKMSAEQRQALVNILIPRSGTIVDKLQFVDAQGKLLDVARSRALPLILAARDELLFGKPSL